MKRYKLIDARRRRGMDQTQLGKALGDVPRDTIGRWEDGTQEPRQDMVQKLCDLFGCTYSYELDLHAAFNCAPHREDELLQMLERLDRRQLIALFSKLSVFAGVDLTVLFSATLIAPDNLLSLCQTVISECWLMLDQGSLTLADNLLTACVSKLDPIATHASQYKDDAVSLAVEATILQMMIATHQTNFARRAFLGESAIKYGGMADDSNIHIMAIGWHGSTYTTCFHQPARAIDILGEAVPSFNDNTRLNQSDISLSLANAYALDGNETKSRDYLEMAHSAIPDDPNLDPLYRVISLGQAELDQREGNVYLKLAQRFPTKKEYPQLAYDAFVKCTNQQSISVWYRSHHLVDKANAARVIGDKDDYLDSLMDGTHVALQVGNQQGISKAVKLLQKTPHNWQTEQKYIELWKILASNSTIVTGQ